MALSKLMTLPCEWGKALKNGLIYSEYCRNSFPRCVNAQTTADVVAFHVMVQSPCDWITLDGLAPPTEKSNSPTVAVILFSVRVEKSPENTTSRLTAVPPRMCFHSDLGNGGIDPAACSNQSACLMSAV